ncbi:MAG: hypothetical protein A3I44_00920 [Candidatus Sungbacteria bacterium RIFCSPLOWO2_02_FULL_51_17]|uniref:YdbS-like PH domain-containing protein n=1 Tax=Candidatus Sungbacteria bacterium RIFCSPHIGHO2_02_FULL_51_29 TaxID=1802273 RepID=A0A1G2KX66_9BACT|nr:MAG: hypothetical protein A2676_00030 [Candidatus Sungbacteria bacterium RIFCSPHIGHO2_01_FULL_51_22]OHA04045.1 MAG: hypothetical protein A3C16_04265 [Candidatus Sungbacteria bacterium RIFCSPHIGHO2_02_FULL_51_29]OHA06864.1 MAG: hypothetical protein A3B29_01595 [Candidatus Sungbacteria bacterium RIFCSPLOWO2_01_FULL_51_34]OHA10683.1 MAG: hypothetical protein A3I44_00920 [Candidatus Sungbacteria bacterium RIFCSPLOWO2_02_FULL_51_17]
MISLRPNEQIVLILRRHWIVMMGPLATIFFALVLPSLLLLSLSDRFPVLSTPQIAPIVKFFLALYLLGLLLYALLLWADYYLDVWIITTERLIDINQRGLFVRHISEMNMENIQNVTAEINGMVAMLLKFGNLKVETAAEGMFLIRSVPRFYEAKDLLLKYSSIKHGTHSEFHQAAKP